MSKAYSFLKDLKTDETHIFEGDFTNEKSCDAEQYCICQKVQIADGNWIDNAGCLTDAQARNKAAVIGHTICGTCVSHLYTTYQK